MVWIDLRFMDMHVSLCAPQYHPILLSSIQLADYARSHSQPCACLICINRVGPDHFDATAASELAAEVRQL